MNSFLYIANNFCILLKNHYFLLKTNFFIQIIYFQLLESCVLAFIFELWW